MSVEELPYEIWLKILRYLDYPKRVEVELVSHQFSLISKATWIDHRKIDIDHRSFNSFAKVSLLLNRCGQYLEEISTHTSLPQSYGDELLLGQICPNLRSIYFHRSSTLCLTNVPQGISPEVMQSETDRLLMSFTKLNRLVFASSKGWPRVDDHTERSTARLLCSLVKIPNLLELHDYIGILSNEIANLQQLQVLSVTKSSLFTKGVCSLTNLRQLFLPLYQIEVQTAWEICDNLPMLESLAVDTFGYKLDYNQIIPILIEGLPLLNTLVVGNRGGVYRRPKIDLSPYRHRPVRLNLFIDDRIRFVFVGSSTQVQLVPVVNYRCGDIVTFLSQYIQNGFDFNNHSTLKVMLSCNEERICKEL